MQKNEKMKFDNNKNILINNYLDVNWKECKENVP